MLVKFVMTPAPDFNGIYFRFQPYTTKGGSRFYRNFGRTIMKQNGYLLVQVEC